jgi:hypothetical protein
LCVHSANVVSGARAFRHWGEIRSFAFEKISGRKPDSVGETTLFKPKRAVIG